MVNLKIEKEKLIRALLEKDSDKEALIDEFAKKVTSKQRACCAMWVENSVVIECPLVTEDL